jgi:hypothetical protein
MTTVVVSAYGVAATPDVGGHFWVPMQYVHGLRQLGCEVFWLEELTADHRRWPSSAQATFLDRMARSFLDRMARFGLARHTILYDASESGAARAVRYFGIEPHAAEAVFRRADLLLNFHYAIDREMLGRFRRTALVDIDPGLLQHWMSRGQIEVAPHDVYLTTGESVGVPGSRIPACGLPWRHIRPPICLDIWPYTHDAASRRFTTVSTWITDDWVTDGDAVMFENTKRVAFLPYAELPSLTSAQLELALYLEGRVDADDRRLLERNGWHVRHSVEVAATPEAYRAYVRQSRGEFSCAKPSCMEFQNAWVSDRTLCYLASGKPVVVQDTGPSRFLPNGEGMFRFSTLEEAADALGVIEASYERHCRAARELAATAFDARLVLAEMLDLVDDRTPAAKDCSVTAP